MITDMAALSEIQRDALREVANIGAGHAATALSMITGTRIMISVPTIAVSPLEELAPLIASPDENVALVPMSMSGGLKGHTILAFPLATAHQIAGIMLRHEVLSTPSLTASEASALTEAGNILAGAYMTGLSELMHTTLLPSPPSLAVGPVRDVLSTSAVEGGIDGRLVFCVETHFMIGNSATALPGYFLLLPDAESLATMLAAASVA